MPDVSLNGIEYVIKGSSGDASDSISRLIKQLDKLNASLARTGSVGKFSSQMKSVGASAKQATHNANQFLSSIVRIAKYRLIRSALKAITSAFQEGLKNAYQFSKINGGELAASMDLLATKSLTMKNQLGASFGALITAIAPIIQTLISMITTLANALTMLFAAIGGNSQYKKATDVWQEWGEAASGAGGAAKEALKYLAPFDELNRLPDENKGGGGGGANTPDYSQMFEYEDLPEWLQNLAEKINEFEASLKLSFNDVFLDWSNLTGEQIAEKVIVGLGAILGASVGFIIGGVPGAIVGSIVGASLGMVFNSVVFNHDGVISKSEVQDMLRLALSGLVGGLIGFSLGGPGGALIGATIGMGIFATLKGIDFLTGGKLSGVLDKVSSALSAGVGGVIGFAVGGPAGAVLGAAIGLGISFGIQSFVFGDTSGWSTSDWISHIVNVLAPVAGAAIGLVVGGPAGAIVGATLGLGVSFAIENFAFPSVESVNGTGDILQGIVNALPFLVGTIGLVVGGPGGAALGAVIGLGIKFAIEKYEFGNESPTGNDGGGTFLGTDVVELRAEIKSFKDAIPDKDKKITTQAKFTSFIKSFSKSSSSTTSKGTPIITSQAKMTSFTRNFSKNTTSGGNPIFNSQAKFTSRVFGDKFSTVFGSEAYFTKFSIKAEIQGNNGALKVPTEAVIVSTSGQGKITMETKAEGGVLSGGLWRSLPKYAGGTARAHGTLFAAGEAGPEVVGHIGGRTEVLNRSQLAATMYSAVRSAMAGTGFRVMGGPSIGGATGEADNEETMYRAMVRALNEANIGPEEITLDGDVVYRNVVNRNKQMKRAYGINPMLTT